MIFWDGFLTSDEFDRYLRWTKSKLLLYEMGLLHVRLSMSLLHRENQNRPSLLPHKRNMARLEPCAPKATARPFLLALGVKDVNREVLLKAPGIWDRSLSQTT